MNRNFNAPMLDLEGNPYADAATLKSVAFAAVQAQLEGDERLDVDSKMRIYTLAGKIVRGGIVEVSAEDLTLMKARIAKAYPPLVMGEAFRLLEEDFVAPPEDEKAIAIP